MKVGDLVTLKKYCKNSDKLAMIVGLNHSAVLIMFSGSGEKVTALKSNLEIINAIR